MAQASRMVHEFPALEEISQIYGLKFGSNSIFAKINNGFKHCFVVTSWGEKGREACPRIRNTRSSWRS